ANTPSSGAANATTRFWFGNNPIAAEMPSEAFRRHFYQMQNTLRLPICRHFHAGGNSNLSARKLIGQNGFFSSTF
ncbi:TPA: hypothetical protein ACKJ4P_002225, partial [Neisseria gonorrhoeae]